MILVIKGALDRIFGLIKVTKNNTPNWKRAISKHNLWNICVKDFTMRHITMCIVTR